MTGSPSFGPADNNVNWKPFSAIEPCSVMLFFLLEALGSDLAMVRSWSTYTGRVRSEAYMRCVYLFSPYKSACGKVSRGRHMVPGGSREYLPKRKVRFADKAGVK